MELKLSIAQTSESLLFSFFFCFCWIKTRAAEAEPRPELMSVRVVFLARVGIEAGVGKILPIATLVQSRRLPPVNRQ